MFENGEDQLVSSANGLRDNGNDAIAHAIRPIHYQEHLIDLSAFSTASDDDTMECNLCIFSGNELETIGHLQSVHSVRLFVCGTGGSGGCTERFLTEEQMHEHIDNVHKASDGVGQFLQRLGAVTNNLQANAEYGENSVSEDDDNLSLMSKESAETPKSLRNDRNKCPECGENLLWKKDLWAHMHKIHGIKMFACSKSYCEKSFSTPYHRNAHQLKFHSTSVDTRVYECDICEKTFNDKANLGRHRFTHNETKQFICPNAGCEKKYQMPHMYNHHKKCCPFGKR